MAFLDLDRATMLWMKGSDRSMFGVAMTLWVA